jgi:hypothetical protein
MNTVYPLARQRMLERVVAGSSLGAATFKAALVDASYVYSASHEVLADISSAILGDAVTLTGVTTADGVFRADTALFNGLTPGDTVKAVIVYAEWSGGTLLFSYQDTASDSSLPATTSSASAAIIWSPSGIFRL